MSSDSSYSTKMMVHCPYCVVFNPKSRNNLLSSTTLWNRNRWDVIVQKEVSQ